jgi:hypothetical protein
MPVDTQHPQYTKYSPVWRMLRDTIEGHRVVNDAGQTYLPALNGQTLEEYRAYLRRAVFFNAVGRVSEALSGMVFRKNPALTADVLGDFVDDITGSGQPLNSFAQEVFGEVVDLGRCGVMVDYASGTGEPVTLTQAAQMGLRPYMALYKAEDIINWRVDVNNGGDMLTLVVLRERREDNSDPFTTKHVEQYRVLRLVEGVYTQELWLKTKQGFALAETYRPLMNGQAMNYIPFRFFGGTDGTCGVVPPLLEDLAYLNLAHYRNTADLEHGLHYTGLPTAVITGVMANDTTYSIGSGNAWVFENKDAKATFLEFTGQGLGPLKEAIKDKEQQMAALGARMLAPEKLAAESSDSISQRRLGETSTLAGLAHNVSRGLTVCLEWLRDWIPAQGDVAIQLNTDFTPRGMTAQDVTALLQAVTTGQISSQSFYEAMVRAEVLAGARTYQEERELIEQNGGDDLGDNA